MNYEQIRYEKTGATITLTLNRPERRNALTDQMLEELSDAFAVADRDRDAACVVLTGAGDKSFCSGADLGGMAQDDSFVGRYEQKGLFPKLFLQMERLSKPTLARVNGACVAGGFGLMMACDLAIAKEGVKFGTPEIARGLFPYMISTFILRGVPRRRALEIMLRGQLFGAEEAEDWHVINRAVPEADFEREVETWVQQISGFSPAVLRLGRAAIWQQAGMPLEGALAHLQGLLTVNTMMEDAIEGITAFFEKRDPVWKGR